MDLERAGTADRVKLGELGLTEERLHEIYLDTEITPYLCYGVVPGEALTTIEVGVSNEAGLMLSGRSQVITHEGVRQIVDLEDIYRDLPFSVNHFRQAIEN